MRHLSLPEYQLRHGVGPSEQKGYIERKIPANNERQKNIYVLPKAVELIEDFQDSFQKVEEEIVQVLTDEEKQVLKKLLIKINERI